MTGHFSGAGMRRIFGFATFCAILALAACQTAPSSPGEGAVASASAASYLQEIRSQHGLTTLAADPLLGRAALKQSGYMAATGRMTHNTGWRRDFGARLKAEGINGMAAENLAHGRMDLEKLFSIWMNSQAHRRNMLNPRLSRFGLAYVRAADGSDVRYWTLVVGD